MITSAANARLRRVAALNRSAGQRREEGAFVIEGVKMFLEAPKALLREVYVSSSFSTDGACKQKLADLGYETVEDSLFARVADTRTPQGILCVAAQPHYRWEDLFHGGNGEAARPLLPVLEDIQDPGNLGTIFRSAEASGATGVILGGQTADLFNPKTIRATMGSVFRMPYFYAQDLRPAVARLRERGVWVYAACLRGGKPYTQTDCRRACAFLIGNEGKGLREETVSLARERVYIPMAGQVESLNAAVATSLFLYEARRQREGMPGIPRGKAFPC